MTVAAYIVSALIIYICVGLVVRKLLQGPDESSFSVVLLWPVLLLFLSGFWIYAKVDGLKRRK